MFTGNALSKTMNTRQNLNETTMKTSTCYWFNLMVKKFGYLQKQPNWQLPILATNVKKFREHQDSI